MYQYSSIPVLLHHIKKWFTVIRTFKTMFMHAYISNLNKSYICSVNKLKGKSVTLSIIKFSSLTLKVQSHSPIQFLLLRSSLISKGDLSIRSIKSLVNRSFSPFQVKRVGGLSSPFSNSKYLLSSMARLDLISPMPPTLVGAGW